MDNLKTINNRQREKDILEAKYNGFKIVDYKRYKQYKNNITFLLGILLIIYFLFGIWLRCGL